MFDKCSDLSTNRLTGQIPVNGSFQLFTPIRSDSTLFYLCVGSGVCWVGGLWVCYMQLLWLCYSWLMAFCLSVSTIIPWILFRHHLQLHQELHLVLEVCFPSYLLCDCLILFTICFKNEILLFSLINMIRTFEVIDVFACARTHFWLLKCCDICVPAYSPKHFSSIYVLELVYLCQFYLVLSM